jgi:hypothetical protein
MIAREQITTDSWKALFVPGRLLENHEGEIDDGNQFAPAIALETDAVLTVNLAKHHRCDLAQFLWLGAVPRR